MAAHGYMLRDVPENGSSARNELQVDAILKALQADIRLNPHWPTDPYEAMCQITDAAHIAAGIASRWQPGERPPTHHLAAALRRTGALCLRALFDIPFYQPPPFHQA